MAHLDLQEQEQISNLKYLWNKGGKYLVGILVLIILSYLVNIIYVNHQSSKANEAAKIYWKFQNASDSNNINEMVSITKLLEQDFAKTEYATLASLELSNSLVSSKKESDAKQYLEWTINNSSDKGMISISKLKLADLYIDESQFDKAMQILVSNKDDMFAPLFYIKRGDLYVAKGNLPKAKDAYKEALQKSGKGSSFSQEIQMRLEVIGGGDTQNSQQ